MKQATKLTAEHKAKTVEYRDEAIRIGLHATDLFNEKLVKELTNAHRVQHGLKKAEHFIVMDSPWQAVSEYKKRGVTVNTALYGQHDANWLWFYKFFRDECGLVEKAEPVQYLIELCREVNWFWVSSNTTIVCRKPVEAKLVNRKRGFTDAEGSSDTFSCPTLHSEQGMALRYRDGKGLYKLNNIDFREKDLIKILEQDPANRSLQDILKVRNTEQRTELMKTIDIEKAISHTDNKTLHEKTFDIGGQYQLLSVNFGDDNRRVYLTGKCPSKGEAFYERVPTACLTVDQALQWRQDYALRKITDQTLRNVKHEYKEPKQQS